VGGLSAGRLLAAALLAGAACGGSANAVRTTTVFASASLTAAFEDLADAYARARPGERVDLHLAGTARLVVQLREGAPGDVFASADEESMDAVVALGRTDGEPRRFARNRLMLVTAPGNPRGVEGLADLARDDLIVVLCGPAVPAGRYARRALRTAGVEVRPASEEPSVKAVLAKLRLGEADAGVVYATDVLAAGAAVEGVALAPEHAAEAAYFVVALRGDAETSAGESFVRFVLSPEARAILRSHGFDEP